MIGADRLGDRTCVPCRGGVPPVTGAELESLRGQVSSEWVVVNGHHLEREFKVPNFRAALDLANRIGEIAEQQRHHPDLLVAWGRLKITLYTHAIDGLHENDFILAARIDQLTRST